MASLSFSLHAPMRDALACGCAPPVGVARAGAARRDSTKIGALLGARAHAARIPIAGRGASLGRALPSPRHGHRTRNRGAPRAHGLHFFAAFRGRVPLPVPPRLRVCPALDPTGCKGP